ncbi:hypothetical protein ABEV15_01835 [Bhargavaea massiliensis]
MLDVVRRLEDHAKEVGQIISLVGDIAGQTNLLNSEKTVSTR